MLQTTFASGLDFLTLWQCWRADPARPRLLHVVALLPAPPSASALRQAAAPDPALAPLADALCAQWHGLQPGVHRLALDDGQVLLTLHVGALQPLLRTVSMVADSVLLDAFSPGDPSHALDAWPASAFKAVARCCQRGTGMAVRSANPAVRKALAQSGFVLAPDALHGHYDPPWVLKRPPEALPPQSARCVVVGGGLAGAAVAASLARRGWRVQVLDAAPLPAAGASGLPAGVLAPHVAVDDPPLSRLSRAGVRATRQVALAQLRAGEDWQPGGVLEHRIEAHRVDGAPAQSPEWRQPDARDAASAWTKDATAARRSAAGLRPDATAALWHPQGGWVRPAQLVQALLAHDRIEWLGGCAVASMAPRPASDVFANELVGDEPPPWQLLDAKGQVLAEAELVVLAAGYATRALLNADAPPLQAVRGQVSWGPMDDDLAAALPPFPVNGHGSVVAGVPVAPGETPDTGGAAHLWVVGASYERDVDEPLVKPDDHSANLDRLRGLLPAAALALESAFTSGKVRGWAGVRCATPDRLPLVGPTRLPGVWVSTAMGSRGISLAVLCGELLAAWLQQEPLPVETALAKRVHSGRFDKGAGKG